MMRTSFLKRDSIQILLVYNVVIIILAAVFYEIIPAILNYPPESINSPFESTIDSGAHYYQQYIVAVLFTMLLSNILAWLQIRGIDQWRVLIHEKDDLCIRKLDKIKRQCFIAPYIIYVLQILLPTLAVILILFLTKTALILTFKIAILIFAFATLLALMSYIFSKRAFKKILFDTNNTECYTKRFKLSFRIRIFMQVLPLVLVSILFSSLVGYSWIIKEKGNLIFDEYKNMLINRFEHATSDISQELIWEKLQEIKLKNSNDDVFIINPKNETRALKGTLSDFFIKYSLDVSPRYDGHTYDYYGMDVQGAVIYLNTEQGMYAVGVKYVVVSNQTIVSLLVSLFIMLLICIVFLLYFSKDISDDVSNVAAALSKVAEGENIDAEKKLPVTSNDEIGDLVIAYNKIQERERENLQSIKENQAILIEQERLASLGQLIGGIAHNLKTPIMSLAGGIEAMKDLVKEYEESIGDPQINVQDHRDIAAEMNSWLEKMKPYCSYMSDVISAVKGQAVQMNSISSSKFTVDELVKRVDLLMKHELKKYHCVLNTDFQIDMNTEIKGEVNNLVQVFDNIIINAVQAYEGNSGTIDFRIVRIGDNVEFTFRDYAKGIPAQIADRLFREMVTTKGKNGTGLGLYMSYSTIKGRFGGSMSFHSKEGAGTTFLISIPCIVYNKQEVSA